METHTPQETLKGVEALQDQEIQQLQYKLDHLKLARALNKVLKDHGQVQDLFEIAIRLCPDRAAYYGQQFARAARPVAKAEASKPKKAKPAPKPAKKTGQITPAEIKLMTDMRAKGNPYSRIMMVTGRSHGSVLSHCGPAAKKAK